MYYLYLFGEVLHREWTKLALTRLPSPLIEQRHRCPNPSCESMTFLWLFAFSLVYLIDVGIPEPVPTAPDTVSGSLVFFKHVLIPPRMARVLHSIFASRVLLHIRAQRDLNLINNISTSISWWWDQVNSRARIKFSRKTRSNNLNAQCWYIIACLPSHNITETNWDIENCPSGTRRWTSVVH